MIQQITNGIKVSVQTNFENTCFQNNSRYFSFSYSITVENQSNNSVQLVSRHWEIFDALNNIEIVDGEGVVGEKPILPPRETHTYKSFCRLTSPTGSMKGHFNMINFSTTKRFKVYVPTFQLMIPAISN